MSEGPGWLTGEDAAITGGARGYRSSASAAGARPQGAR